MSHMKPGGRTVVRPYNVGGGCKQSRLHIKCRDAPRCVRTYIHEYRQEHTGGRTAVRPYKKVRRQNRTPSVSSTWLRVLVTLVTSGVS